MINIGRAIKNLLSKKQDTIIAIPGILGDKTGIVNTDRKNYVYARVGNAIISVFNNRVNAQYGLPVMIGYDPAQPGLLQVLSVRDINVGGNTQYQVPAHHENHEYPHGNDIVYMQLRQFLPLRITPLGGFKVAIYRAIVWGNSFKVVNDTLDLFQYCPVQPFKACYVLITISNDGSIDVTKGNEVDISTLSLSNIPQIPSTAKYVIGAIRLYSSQTEIKESGTDTDIVDLRYPIWHTHSSDEISNLVVYKKFTELEDTPSIYVGYGGKTVKVKTTEDGLEFGNIPSSFLDLNDTPSSYSGQEGKVVSVKSDASGLEFTTPLTGSGTSGRIAKFSGANTIADSVMTETSDGVQIDTGKTLVLNGYGLDWDGYFAKFPKYYPQDHFTTASMSSYWDGWTTSPSYVEYNHRNHWLVVVVNNPSLTYFLYRNQTVSNGGFSEAWTGTDQVNTTAGIRFDNGFLDNSSEYSVELYLRSLAGIDGTAVFLRRNAYGTITEVRLTNYFPPGKAFLLRLSRFGNTCYAQGFDEAIGWDAVLGSIGVASDVTFTRHGLFVRCAEVAYRAGGFHFYATNF